MDSQRRLRLRLVRPRSAGRRDTGTENPPSPLNEVSRALRRRVSTSSDSAFGEPASGHLPADVLADQSRRLRLFSLVACGCWAFGLTVDSLAGSLAPGGGRVDLWKSQVVEVGGIACSLCMWAYVRWGRATDERKIDAGLAYLIVNAVFVALLNSWVVAPRTTPTVQPSWNTSWC